MCSFLGTEREGGGGMLVVVLLLILAVLVGVAVQSREYRPAAVVGAGLVAVFLVLRLAGVI